MIDVMFPTFILFLFNFNVQYRAVSFIYLTAFQEDSKLSCVVGNWWGGGRVGVWGHDCFKILACLISFNVFGLLFSPFIMGFIIIIIIIIIIISSSSSSSSIHIIIIITTIVMVITIFIYTQSI